MIKFNLHWEEEWPSARVEKPFDPFKVEAGTQQINYFPSNHRFPLWPKCEGESVVFATSRKDAILTWYNNFPFSSILLLEEVA